MTLQNKTVAITAGNRGGGIALYLKHSSNPHIINISPPSREFTGNYCIDEDILREANRDPSQYAVNPNAMPVKDIFLPSVITSFCKRFCDSRIFSIPINFLQLK